MLPPRHPRGFGKRQWRCSEGGDVPSARENAPRLGTRVWFQLGEASPSLNSCFQGVLSLNK